MRHRAGDHASQAMSNEMNFFPCLRSRAIDGLIQMPLDEKVGAVGVEPDPRKIRLVTNSSQPAMKFHQVEVSSQKPGNNNDA